MLGEERELGGKRATGGEESSPPACNTPAAAIGGVANTTENIGSGADVRNDTRFVRQGLLNPTHMIWSLT